MSQYNPLNHSVVQLIKGDRFNQFEVSDFVEALFFGLCVEIKRVHWNIYQHSWDRWSDDPEIPGVHWQQYQYDCECPEADGWLNKVHHLDGCGFNKPNFAFEGVEFNWYKNPGRGMSVNVDWDERQWRAWFDRCLTQIRLLDVRPHEGDTERQQRDAMRQSYQERHPEEFAVE